MRSLYFLGLASIALTFTACGRQNYDKSVVDQTYVHRYGVAVPEDFWTSSGEHGSVISSMSDGVVVTRSYISGMLDGDTTYSYPHSSQIQKREVYLQGTLIKSTDYFFDGTAKSETTYDTPIGIKTVTSWYHNGIPKSVEQYAGDLLVNGEYFTTFNQNDAAVENYAGKRLVRDEYGQLIATETIVGGQLVLRTSYHPNGAPMEMTPYKDGLVDGTKKSFYPAGEPASIEMWSAGKQNGTTTNFQHGEKFAEVPYVNGVKHGKELHYRDGSVVVQELSWENNQQHGCTTTYVGEVTKTDWHYRGVPMSKIDYDFMLNRPAARF